MFLRTVPARVRFGVRFVAFLGVGALVLASCASTPVASQRLSGTPALSISVPLTGVTTAVTEALDAVHAVLLGEATALRSAHTVDASSLDEAVEAASSGFAVLPLSVIGADGETTLNRAGASIRCIQTADGGLPGADDDRASTDSQLIAVVGRAY